MGYFLGKIGRENLFILHEENEIETPSDYAGIVYEPYDRYGAWKSKLIKEMKRASIHIEPSLIDRI